MHANPLYRRWPEADAYAFARERGFGVLTVPGLQEPLAAHIPFLLSEDGSEAEFHLHRSSRLALELEEDGSRIGLLAVSGPDAYVSPDWYGAGPDNVPTWNYQAVHLRGTVWMLSREELKPHLERLSAFFEARLAPKPPWTLDKTSEGYVERLSRGITPFVLQIDRIESTLKLGQNKPTEARLAAADGIAESGVGSAPSADLAAMMRRAAKAEDRSNG